MFTDLKCPCDKKKITSFFSSEFESVFAKHLTGKILSFEVFIQRALTLKVCFGFHDPPFLTCKTDRLDLRGLDPGKNDVKVSLLKTSACERSLLYMQSRSLKV